MNIMNDFRVRSIWKFNLTIDKEFKNANHLISLLMLLFLNFYGKPI